MPQRNAAGAKRYSGGRKGLAAAAGNLSADPELGKTNRYTTQAAKGSQKNFQAVGFDKCTDLLSLQTPGKGLDEKGINLSGIK